MTLINDKSTDIQVWFLRHGKTDFNYDNSNYDDFIQMLCNGHSTPLATDHGIDFISLPKRVDLVGYSPTTRAVETAELLRDKLCAKRMEELELLREVRFDWNIILTQEYICLFAGIGFTFVELWLGPSRSSVTNRATREYDFGAASAASHGE